MEGAARRRAGWRARACLLLVPMLAGCAATKVALPVADPANAPTTAVTAPPTTVARPRPTEVPVTPPTTPADTRPEPPEQPLPLDQLTAAVMLAAAARGPDVHFHDIEVQAGAIVVGVDEGGQEVGAVWSDGVLNDFGEPFTPNGTGTTFTPQTFRLDLGPALAAQVQAAAPGSKVAVVRLVGAPVVGGLWIVTAVRPEGRDVVGVFTPDGRLQGLQS